MYVRNISRQGAILCYKDYNVLHVYFSYQDVAEVALYRCVNRESMVNSKGSNEATKIEYSYEFLEDYVTPQPTLANFIQDKFTKEKEQPPKIDTSTVYENPSSTHDMPLESFSNVQNFSHSNNTSQENVEEDTETNDDQDAWWLQEKYDPENHPLELMVRLCVCEQNSICIYL